MKSILISIKPKYVADILNGKKTIEIRKTMPKCDLPIIVYIYCTKDQELFYHKLFGRREYFVKKNRKSIHRLSNGVVVAKFTLNKVEEIQLNLGAKLFTKTFNEEELLKNACLTTNEIEDYLFSNIMQGYAWHIDNLVIFDKPMELSEFQVSVFPNRKNNLLARYLVKAPLSWCYVEV